MKVCLLGVDFNNANLGCQALGYSFISIASEICKSRNEKLDVVAIVYDGSSSVCVDNNGLVSVNYIVIRAKKLSFYQEYKRILKEVDFSIDFTGGDSFSDIYGVKRFTLASILKELAIRSKTPFIMGPQTVGPFANSLIKKWASSMLQRSSCVFVRDEASGKFSQEIAGIQPMITTDVAFALPYEKRLCSDNGKIKVGINPSGLLWFKNRTFDGKGNLSVQYRDYLKSVITQLLDDGRYEIHLIPHVFAKKTVSYEENWDGEDDMQACFHIKKLFPEVIIEREINNPMEAKSVISSMDVFTGARMHATIGAFSAGVPVVPFSYSRKFEGLFGSLGYSYLVNGREVSTEEAVEKTIYYIENSKLLQDNIVKSMELVSGKLGVFEKKLNEYCMR